MSPELREKCEEAMHVIDEDGIVYRGGEAYVFLQKAFKRPFSSLLGLHPMRTLVDFAYWVVSHNRPTFANVLYTKEKWVE